MSGLELTGSLPCPGSGRPPCLLCPALFFPRCRERQPLRSRDRSRAAVTTVRSQQRERARSRPRPLRAAAGKASRRSAAFRHAPALPLSASPSEHAHEDGPTLACVGAVRLLSRPRKVACGSGTCSIPEGLLNRL
ncbi:uncharacterized protein V5649_010812 [Rhynchonycteris naso]